MDHPSSDSGTGKKSVEILPAGVALRMGNADADSTPRFLSGPLRMIAEAEGYAALGLFEDAWETLETLPPRYRFLPDALAVRLMICTAPEMGTRCGDR